MSSQLYGEDAGEHMAELNEHAAGQPHEMMRGLMGLLHILPDSEPPSDLLTCTLDRLDTPPPQVGGALEPA
jgi:hypothetical protein